MKLVATKAPENALKVMKLAGNTVVTTLFNYDNIGSALSNFFQGGLGTVGTEDPFETPEDVDEMDEEEEAPNVGLLGKIKDIWMRQEAVAPVLGTEFD
ncbi:hypothetical protein [Candidatus Regiella insecticola]|nr:hypothetical protein [Candidatus Regiella insecticola]